MFYINYKEKHKTHTIAEFNTEADAQTELERLQTLQVAGEEPGDRNYYISKRATKAWSERELLPAEEEEEEVVEDAAEAEELPEAPVTVDDQDPDDVYIDCCIEVDELPCGKLREELVGNEDEEFIPTDEDSQNEDNL